MAAPGRREALVRAEVGFVGFFVPLLCCGILVARLPFATAAIWATGGAVVATVLVMVVLRCGARSGENAIAEERRDRPVEEPEPVSRTLPEKVRFYSWALPMVAVAFLVGMALTFVVPIAIVIAYAVLSPEARWSGALAAAAVSIGCILLNEKVVVEPLCRRWRIPRT